MLDIASSFGPAKLRRPVRMGLCLRSSSSASHCGKFLQRQTAGAADVTPFAGEIVCGTNIQHQHVLADIELPFQISHLQHRLRAQLAHVPNDDWKKLFVIDARDKEQFAKEHIPGAVNIEWRRALAERSRIPKDKPVLVYCNTGTLSAQAGFALRVAGYENVRILQGGDAEWKAKGGLVAAAKATGAVKH